MSNVRLAIRINPELRKKIEAIAKKEHRTLSEQVRYLLEKALQVESNISDESVENSDDNGPIGSVEPVEPNEPRKDVEPVEPNEPSKDVEPQTKNSNEKPGVCRTCGAPLPKGFKGDYCPDVYSCGNHLHVLGQPHNAKLCAFCSFPGEVKTVVNKRKNGWAWEKIWNVLTESHTIDEANGIEQAAKLLLNETE